LSTPLIITTFNIPIETTNNENRTLEKSPSISWNNYNSAETVVKKWNAFFNALFNYKNDFDKYYKDNFIFKSLLFDSYKKIKLNLFQTNPIPPKVLKGKDGWYFLGNSFSEVTLESLGLDTLNKNELEQIKRNYEGNQQWFKDQGIDYYIAIAPNKHSIYHDFLGVRISPNRKKEINQLASLMKPRELINLGKGFKEKDEQLFLKTNTHWNDLGAYYGYENLMHFLQLNYPVLSILSLDEVRDSSVLSNSEDLTEMLGIPANEIKTELFIKDRNAKRQEGKIDIPENVNPLTYEIRYKSEANPLKILFFRDSFSTDMIDYIAEGFGESVFIWNHMMSKELILKEKPDIVIHEFIERDIQILSYETLKP